LQARQVLVHCSPSERRAGRRGGRQQPRRRQRRRAAGTRQRSTADGRRPVHGGRQVVQGVGGGAGRAAEQYPAGGPRRSRHIGRRSPNPGARQRHLRWCEARQAWQAEAGAAGVNAAQQLPAEVAQAVMAGLLWQQWWQPRQAGRRAAGGNPAGMQARRISAGAGRCTLYGDPEIQVVAGGNGGSAESQARGPAV